MISSADRRGVLPLPVGRGPAMRVGGQGGWGEFDKHRCLNGDAPTPNPLPQKRGEGVHRACGTLCIDNTGTRPLPPIELRFEVAAEGIGAEMGEPALDVHPDLSAEREPAPAEGIILGEILARLRIDHAFEQ